MNTIIDIYNEILFYNNNEINYIIDINNIIWFKFISISKILEYKSTKDVLRDHINKEHKIQLKNIKSINKNNIKQPDTVYINENGLYTLLIKSRMKKAYEFQLWLINIALPKLRESGKYEVDKKTRIKLDNLNKKIKLLKDINKKLKNNMTKNKYPRGYHFYIIKDDNMYKIGYTKDLNKRLSVYNTGKANISEYAYFKKTDCAKEIEECMKALLNKYIYKSNKEFYDCSLNTILKEVKKCLTLESKCSKCKDIVNQKGGNNNTIIEELINNYINEYNIIIYKLIQ
jgi:prophage antirepressor-like protein